MPSLNLKTLAVCASLASLLALQACGDDPAAPPGSTWNPQVGAPGAVPGGAGAPGAQPDAGGGIPGAVATTAGGTGIPGPGPQVTPGGGTTGGQTPGGTMGAGADTFCRVKDVLRSSCQTCHGAEKAFGAPMSLVTHADLLAKSPIDGRPNYQVMIDRAQDATRPMPPSPNPRLSAEQIGVLQAWVAAGRPDNASCAAPQPDPNTKDPNCIDCGNYSCDASKGKPLQLLAHGKASAGDTTPYDASSVGSSGSPDLYQCFYFKAPWATGAQSIGYKPVIDNKRVLHHWLLYGSDQAPAEITDGGMKGRCQAQGDPNRVLLAGWAPGTPGINLPTGVGQKLPAGSRGFITLEVHYYNTEPGKPAMDRSGIELCMANTPQPNVATQHWLGTEKISVAPSATKETGDTCTPRLTTGQTSTIISITPHMHKTGIHSKLEVLRQGGKVEVLHDKPFEFENQTTYMLPTPVVINPGDKLRTTCRFRNGTSMTKAYGEGSDEEMCYLFTTAYPAGSLHNGKNGCFFGVCIPGGVTRCIDNENIADGAGAL